MADDTGPSWIVLRSGPAAMLRTDGLCHSLKLH